MKKGFRILKFKKDKPIFEVKDVSKSFDGRPILKKLSLKVFPGECVGVLGPNGCGKTTLFSMCIGEQNIDGGKIYLNNKLFTIAPTSQFSDEAASAAILAVLSKIIISEFLSKFLTYSKSEAIIIFTNLEKLVLGFHSFQVLYTNLMCIF